MYGVREYLQTIPYLAGLTESDLSLITEHSRLYRFVMGDIVFLEGDASRGLWVIESGVVKIYKTGADGGEYIMHLSGAGATFNDIAALDGGVRAEIAADTDITARGAYQPYGLPTDVEGAYSQPFRFTGEMLDTNALQYHRARYYGAGTAGWASLDPFEGMMDRAMSLNGYSWVEGNVINATDPTGSETQLQCYSTCYDNPCHRNIDDPFLFTDLQPSANPNYIGDGNCPEIGSQPWNSEFRRCVMRCDYYHTNKYDEYKSPATPAQILALSVAIPLFPLVLLGKGIDNMLCSNQGSMLGVVGTMPRPTGGVPPWALIGGAAWLLYKLIEGAFPDTAQPQPQPNNNNYEFVGFHGTSLNFARNLTQGIFDSSAPGTNTGVDRLQFGIGLYVVKANSPLDDDALGMAEFFGLQASQSQNSPMVVLKTYARDFRLMRGLLHNGSMFTMPSDYMLYDYIIGPIANWNFTQVKFNPHALVNVLLTF